MGSDHTPLHIGFIFYDYQDSRMIDAINGIYEVIGDDKVTLFPTGPLNSEKEFNDNNRTKVLETLKNSNLDCVITLQFWDSEEWFKKLLFDNLSCPIIPLLRTYECAHGILVPYEQGSYDAVKHLIDQHGCRKPYYIEGSARSSINLRNRFEGYRKALKDSGIEYDDSMRISLEGSFSTGSLVSGAYHQGSEAVKKLFIDRGLNPGIDLDSLVIFNDRMAMEVIEALTKLNITVPEDLKIISFDNIKEAETASTPLTTSAIHWYQLGAEGIRLARRLVDEKNTDKPHEVPPTLIIRNSCGCTSPVELLLDDSINELSSAEQKELFQNITHDYNHINLKLQSTAKSIRDSMISKNAAMLLAKCDDLESFAETLTLLLHYMGIAQCSIHLVDPYVDERYIRHIQWSKNCDTYSFHKESIDINSIKPLSGDFSLSICDSLDQGDRHLGFLLYGTNNCSFISYGELRELLSSIIYSLFLMEDLKKTQDQLIQKEKFSSLGRLVAGVAHEVNTPIGVGITASSHLTAEVQQLKELFDSGHLSKQAFSNALQDIEESSTIIEKNLERAGNLITSFKNVSVDNVSDTVRRFLFREHLQDTLLTLKPIIRKSGLEVTVNCSEEIELVSNPGILSQIFSNLITNSIKHGFPDEDRGDITITAQRYKESEIKIIYEDSGKGMDAGTLKKIYEPFFTTGRNRGGSGLGMFIIFNMITQKLGGRINVDSSPGNGIKVEIYLPILLSI